MLSVDEDVAEAIGLMMQNAPSLHEFVLSGCRLGPVEAKLLANGLRSETSGLKKLFLMGCGMIALELLF